MAEGSAIDYWNKVVEHRDKVLAVLKETDWVEAKNKNGIKVFSRQTEKGKMFRIEVELNAAPATAKRYFTPGKINGLREQANKKIPIKEFSVIEKGDKYVVAREILHGAMLGIISERDVVSVYGGEDDSEIGSETGVAYLIHCSVEHPDYPPQAKPVRAFKHMAGQLFFPAEGDPNKCIMRGVAQIDLGGMVPVSVVNSFQPNMLCENATQIRQAIDNKLHEKNMA